MRRRISVCRSFISRAFLSYSFCESPAPNQDLASGGAQNSPVLLALQAKADLDGCRQADAIPGNGVVDLSRGLQSQIIQKQYVLWQNETHTLVSQLTWIEHSAAAESLPQDTPTSPLGTDTNMNGARTTAINVATIRQINNIGRWRQTKRRHA
jgi:hypothetical protein